MLAATTPRRQARHLRWIDSPCDAQHPDWLRPLYKKRKETIEREFADAKEHRGVTRFTGYGPRQAETQVGLLFLLTNGKSLTRLRRAATLAEGIRARQSHTLSLGAGLGGGVFAAPSLDLLSDRGNKVVTLGLASP